MSQALRFLAVLVLGLALLTWLASAAVRKTTREWYDKDINLRSELVLNGARQALVGSWSKNEPKELLDLLTDVTHDERILAAAACGIDLEPLAMTVDFPAKFPCRELGPRVRPSADALASEWKSWRTQEVLPGGEVHVTAWPLIDGERALGFVVLVHDLSFVARRDAQMQKFLLLAFGFLAAAASLITVVAARLSWRSWSNELRRLIRGEGPRPEFQPLMRDVRELVDRIAAERETDSQGGLWTPTRLKQTLNRHLHGERVVILANREPYIHARAADGSVAILHPASGLVTALEPVMRACSGTWVAHGAGSADKETADRHSHVRVPPGEESYVVRRVWLTPEEEKGYYYGFSNEGLWPLCHLAHARPLFRGEDWKYYQAVNQKFADAVCAEVDSDDAIILVQDYHFALAPRMIREKLPRATVMMFWHIPWPNSERFGICPWRDELLEGMLGASILGFHTQVHCNNFVDSVDRYMESRIDREQNAVVHGKRSTLVRPYPISIDWPSRWATAAPPPAECRASVFSELKLAPDALLGVGVDRLDYTKGVEERLLAVERLLEQFPGYRGRFTFVQLAAPSRTVIERYRQLNDSVEQVVARINERFGSGTYRPIILLRTHHEPPTVFRYYRAADVCYVSSLHDGMNLVAKEFVAAREDERGVLVLSHFTGAARELTEALIVNPYDLDEASAALASALAMSPDEQQDRMRAMRTFVSEFNVYRWAGRMLVDAARLRRRDRLTGRLSEHLLSAVGVAQWRHILSLDHRSVLQQFAWSNVVLAFDYDGTLAPIVSDPEKAVMRPRTRALMEQLTKLYPCIVISGRGHGDALRRMRGVGIFEVVGNHGMEPWAASRRFMERVARWRAKLVRLLSRWPGVRVEDKGFSLAIHYRQSREKKKARAAILRAAAALESARIIGGKQVVNVLPLGAPLKGLALERGRARLRCDTALYIGDDETDEDVFALDQPGRLLSIRVGASRRSLAHYYIRSQSEVDRLLRELIRLRRSKDDRLGVGA